jgi:ferredoxin
VTIAVLEEGGKETSIEAKVGDNLRKVLLENNIEVYKGLKKKLGNCGGGGQCTFCAADFVESEGWGLRSDYEDGKLKKFPNARLTCLNNIQGPATIRI